MTYRDPAPEPARCPVCEHAGSRPPVAMDGWWCPECRLLFTGTMSEWVAHETHRNRRKDADGS